MDICLRVIPHKKFTFAMIWLLAAKFQIRQSNLLGARKIVTNAIGMAPKDKVQSRLLVRSSYILFQYVFRLLTYI